MTQECLWYFCKCYLLFVLTYCLGVLATEQDSWGEVLDKNRLADDPCHKELTHIISVRPNQVMTFSAAELSRLRAQLKLTVKLLHLWILTRLVWERASTNMTKFASVHSCYGSQLSFACVLQTFTHLGWWHPDPRRKLFRVLGVLNERLQLITRDKFLDAGRKGW